MRNFLFLILSALLGFSPSSFGASSAINFGVVGNLGGYQGTDWVSFTPTGAWNTNTTYTGKWRRVGDQMEIGYHVATSGAPNAASLTLNLPSGYTIDTAKLAAGTTASSKIDAEGLANVSGSGNYQVYAIYSSTTAINLRWNSATSDGGQVNATSPGTWGASSDLQLFARVPIVGWSSSGAGGATLPRSEIWLHTANGYGSTNTNTTRFTTTQSSTGADITYTDSATAGASFTINTTGVYSMSGWWFDQTASSFFGWTLNQSTLTDSIVNVPASERLGIIGAQVSGGNDNFKMATVTKYLQAGDVVRFVGVGVAATVAARCGLIITKVSN